MYLFAVFLVLFSSWIFWGWIVGESRNIRWMRNWCAGIFVVLCILVCLGGGTWISRRLTQSFYRTQLTQLTQLLNDRMKEGRVDDVREALQYIAEEPDESTSISRDPLQRMSDVTAALQKTARSRVATKSKNLQ